MSNIQEKIEEFKSYLGCYTGEEWMITFFTDMVSQAVQEERMRILDGLPEERDIKNCNKCHVVCKSFNDCLSQVKSLIQKDKL